MRCLRASNGVCGRISIVCDCARVKEMAAGGSDGRKRAWETANLREQPAVENWSVERGLGQDLREEYEVRTGCFLWE